MFHFLLHKLSKLSPATDKDMYEALFQELRFVRDIAHPSLLSAALEMIWQKNSENVLDSQGEECAVERYKFNNSSDVLEKFIALSWFNINN